MRHPTLIAGLSAAALLLAGCKSPEEKAQDFYLSGVEFMSAGDMPRAEIELRNALKWNETHRDARRAMADVHLAEGDLAQAYATLLDYVERWPGAADVRHHLAVIALRTGDWAELERHAEAVASLAPHAPEAAAMEVVLRYRKARLGRDAEARAAAAAEARDRLDSDPSDGLMLRVVLDDLMTGPTPQRALPILDAALQRDPKDRKLHLMRVSLLTRHGDAQGAGRRLMQMADLFPEDESIRGMAVAWLLQQGDAAGAEAYLRSLAAADPDDVEGPMHVVRLLRATGGDAAARAELDRLVAQTDAPEDAHYYRAYAALMAFEAGEREAGLADARSVIERMGPGDRRARVRVILASMLEEAGDLDGAEREIDAVLRDHPAQVDALKTRARWMLEEDRANEAVVVLRSALDHDPRDPAILILLAGAHFLSGNPELAGERLADAVDASAYAPAESLRYVRHLRRTGRPDVAAHVLLSARARSPGSIEVATATADLFIQRQDWRAAGEVARDLSRLGTPAAREASFAVQAGILAAQDRHAEGVQLLHDLARRSGTAVRPALAMAGALLRAGRLEQARVYLDQALAETPGDRDLRLISGSLHAQANELAAAEATYRALAEADPSDVDAVRLLVALLRATGREAEAAAWLARGLQAAPGSRPLRMAEASRLEAVGDIDAALALTEALYAEAPGDVVAANNLASLLATWGTEADLARADALARRLASIDAPGIRHTRGWIAYRRGDVAAAIPDLEAAAAGLPANALVQFHLGMAYASWGRTGEAARQFATAEALADAGELDLMEDVLDEAQAAWAAKAETEAGVARP